MKFLTRQSRSKNNKKNKETPSTIEDEKKDTDENDTGLRLDSPSKDASSDIDIQKYESSLKSTEYDSYDESYCIAPLKRSLLYKKQPDHSFNGEVYYEDFGERAHSIMKTRYFDTIPFLQNDHDTVIKVEVRILIAIKNNSTTNFPLFSLVLMSIPFPNLIEGINGIIVGRDDPEWNVDPNDEYK